MFLSNRRVLANFTLLLPLALLLVTSVITAQEPPFRQGIALSAGMSRTDYVDPSFIWEYELTQGAFGEFLRSAGIGTLNAGRDFRWDGDWWRHALVQLWMPDAQWLGFQLGARIWNLDYAPGLVSDASELSLYGGASATFPLGRRFRLGVNGRVGLATLTFDGIEYYDDDESDDLLDSYHAYLLEQVDENGNPLYLPDRLPSQLSLNRLEWGVGISSSFRLTKWIGIETDVGYRRLTGLAAGLYSATSVAVHLPGLRSREERFGGMLDERPTPLSTLEVSQLELEPVFPVFYSYYRDHPIGTVQITNAGEEPVTNLELTFMQDELMGNPTSAAVAATIPPGESVRAEVYALFTDRILAVTEGTTVSGRLSLGCTCDERQHVNEEIVSLEVLNRNAITWTDDRKVAAFVTARDDEVLAFSRAAAAAIEALPPTSIDPALLKLMAVHEALRLFGTTYSIDPVSAYESMSQDATVVDFLQFPRQTLRFKSGDCDDLSVLYAALLESLGVPTAFVTIPGHIFMAVKLDTSPARLGRAYTRPDDLIVTGEAIWLPFEVTMLDAGFLEAWRYGAREWRRHADGAARLYPTADAWQEYRPVGFAEPIGLPQLPEPTVMRESLGAALGDFAQAELFAPVAELREALQTARDPRRLHCRIGALYAGFGQYEEAATEFEATLGDGPYWPALVNLGTIAFASGDYAAALDYYEQAHTERPDQPAVLLALARTHHARENYGTVSDLYATLAGIDPELAAKHDYLSLRSDEAQRAARESTRFAWITGEEE